MDDVLARFDTELTRPAYRAAPDERMLRQALGLPHAS